MLDLEEEAFLHREGVLEDASDLENLASNFLGGGQKSAEKGEKEIIIGGDGWIGGEGDTVGGRWWEITTPTRSGESERESFEAVDGGLHPLDQLLVHHRSPKKRRKKQRTTDDNKDKKRRMEKRRRIKRR